MRLTRYLAAGFIALAIGASAIAIYFCAVRASPAPDIAFTRLDGSAGHIAGLRGKVVLINFWATTCEICVKDMPQMIATHRMFQGRDYETLAVAMSYDPPFSVVRFAESHKLPFTIIIDNTGSVARGFGGVEATPVSLLIDKHGDIVKRYVGEPDFADLRRRVEKLLAEA